MNTGGDILVLAEHKNGELDGITFQLLSKGRELAGKLGGQLKALVLGNRTEAVTRALDDVADVVLLADHSLLDPYNPEIYGNVVGEVLKNAGPSLFLIGHTFLGMEIGPAIAARLGLTLVTNCVDVETTDGVVTVTRPIFGGVSHARLELQGPGPHLVSLQKGRLPKKSLSGRKADFVCVPVKIDESSLRTRVIGAVEASIAGIDITRADIVVAVGRGIGGKTNIQLAEELARAIGGVVACSRPVADFGWLPQEQLVGMSGRTVKPRVYLACGISGASQHVAGMVESQCIIAINKDRSAPIFQVAHYGVVGDVLKIISLITLK
ncbi:MAG: electron transfer flavoprotein subunit alpha/FixB family protein [Chloroflexi bacterium]|nr:electron transfer flavoprotein subunit alpha/FixB family protein [Chloroflexota bacterium]